MAEPDDLKGTKNLMGALVRIAARGNEGWKGYRGRENFRIGTAIFR
jgi:hypothetical protein